MSEIETLDAAIAKLQRPLVPIEHELWGTRECADYFKCSDSQFVQYIKTHHEFPRPVSIPLAKNRAVGKAMRMHDRWKAADVIEYADTCKVR